jgi:molybdate transport repressor ModE-like protein
LIRIDIQPVWRFRNKGEREFDFMLIALLESLERNGKLTLAAHHAGISYRHAWNLIEKWAEFFGAPLVEVDRGRGTTLSPLGTKLLWAAKRAHARLTPELDSLASELASDLNETLFAGQPALRIHASHDFAITRLRDLLANAGFAVDLQSRGSFDALGSFARGGCELAGFHLVEGPLGPLMGARYLELLKPETHKVIWFVSRTQGLIVAPGNPKEIRSVRDLARPEVTIVNRQRGSGTRALLEFMISHAAVERGQIRGYDNEEFTHTAVAALVAGQQADVGFGIEAAAAQFRLDFVPLATERYFIVCREEHLALPAVQALLGILRSAEFRNMLATLPGYSAPRAGEISPAAEIRASLPQAAAA